MSRNLGEARISIVPDGTKLKPETEAAVKKAVAGVQGKIKLDIDSDKLRAQATAAAKSATEGLSGKVKLEADSRDLDAQILAMKAKTDALSKSLGNLKISDPNIQSFMKGITRQADDLKNSLDKVGDSKGLSTASGQLDRMVASSDKVRAALGKTTFAQEQVGAAAQAAASKVADAAAKEQASIDRIAKARQSDILDQQKGIADTQKMYSNLFNDLDKRDNIKVGLDGAYLDKDAATIRAKIDALTKDANIRVGLKGDDAEAEALGLRERINAILSDIKAKVHVDNDSLRNTGSAITGFFEGEVANRMEKAGNSSGQSFMQGMANSTSLRTKLIAGAIAVGLAALPAAVGAIGALGGIALGAGLMIGAESLVKKQLKTLTADIKTQTAVLNAKSSTPAMKKAAQDALKSDLAQVDALNKEIAPLQKVKDAVNNLKIAFVNFAVTVTKPLIAPFARAINDLSNELNGPLKKSFTSLFKAVAPLVAPVLSAILEIVEFALPGLTSMLTKARGPLTEMIVGFGRIVGMKVGQWFRDATPYIKDSGRYLNDLVGFLGDAISWLIKFGGETAKAFAGGQFKGFGGIISQLGADLTSILIPAFISWSKVMAPIVKALAQILLPLLNFLANNPALVKAITLMWTAWSLWGRTVIIVTTALKLLRPVLAAIDVELDANAIGLIALALLAIAAAAYEIITHWKPIAAFFVGIWKDIYDGWGKYLLVLFGPTGDMILITIEIVKHWSSIASFFVGVWKSIYSGFVGPLVNFFMDTIPHAFDVTINWLKKNWPVVTALILAPMTLGVSLVVAAVIKYRAQIIGALTDVKNFIIGVFDQVKTWITTNFDKWWAQNGEEIKQIWGAIWGAMKAVFVPIWDGIVKTAQIGWTVLTAIFKTSSGILRDVWSGSWTILSTVAKAAWVVIRAVTTTGWSIVTDAFKTGIDIVRGVWNVFWSVLSATAKTTWNIIRTLTSVEWDAVKAIFDVAVKVISAAWKIFWNVLVNVAKVAWAAVQAVAKVAWDVLVGIFTVAINLLTGHWSKAWNALRVMFQQVWNAIKAFLVVVLNAIVNIVETAWTTVSHATTSAWNSVFNFFKSVWGHIENVFTDALKSITNWLTTAWTTVSHATTSAWNSVFNFFKSVWSHIENVFTDAFKSITGWLTTAWTNISRATMSAWNSVFGFFKGIWSGMKNTAQNSVSWISDKLSSVWNNVRKTASRIWGGIVSDISAAWSKIKDVVRNPINIVIGFINTLVGGVDAILSGIGVKGGGPHGGPIGTIPKLATGGRISKGTGEKADDVLIRVSKNETVLSADHSRKLAPALSAVGVPGYAKGGAVNGTGPVGNTGNPGYGPRMEGKLQPYPVELVPGFAAGGKTQSGTEVEKVMLGYMESKIGHPYSQTLGRFGPKYFDCSGLVYDAAKAGGVPIPQSDALAHLEMEYFSKLPGAYTYRGESQMQPGDIIGMTGADPIASTFGGIGHIGMAIDKNRMVSALGTKWGVTESNVDKFVVGVSLAGAGGKNVFTNLAEQSITGLESLGGLVVNSVTDLLQVAGIPAPVLDAIKGITGATAPQGTGSGFVKQLTGGMGKFALGKVGPWLAGKAFSALKKVFSPQISAAEASGGVGGPAGGATGTNMQNGTSLYKYLLSNLFGGNQVAAAGATASIWGESGWNPFAQGTGGRGLIGWTPPSTISNAAFKGGMATQEPAIIDFVQRNGDMGAVNQMKSASSVAAAANIWGKKVERYGINDVHSQGIALATEIMNASAGSANTKNIAGSADATVLAHSAKKASGGHVPGFAPGSDTVHAMLSPGEYVLNPTAVRAIGVGNLDAMNNAHKTGATSSIKDGVARFAAGGHVSGATILAKEAQIKKEKNIIAALEAVKTPTSSQKLALKNDKVTLNLYDNQLSLYESENAAYAKSLTASQKAAAVKKAAAAKAKTLAAAQKAAAANKENSLFASLENQYGATPYMSDAKVKSKVNQIVTEKLRIAALEGTKSPSASQVATLDSDRLTLSNYESQLATLVKADKASAATAAAAKAAAAAQAADNSRIQSLGEKYSHAQLIAMAASYKTKMNADASSKNYKDYATTSAAYNDVEAAISKFPTQLNAQHDEEVAQHNTAVAMAAKYLKAKDYKDYAIWNQKALADAALISTTDSQISAQAAQTATLSTGADPISTMANDLATSGMLKAIGYQMLHHSLDPAPTGKLSHADMTSLAYNVTPDSLQAIYDNSATELVTALKNDLVDFNMFGNIGTELSLLGKESGVHGIVSGLKFQLGGMLPAGAGFGMAGGVPFSFNEGGNREKIVPGHVQLPGEKGMSSSQAERLIAATKENTCAVVATGNQTNKNLGGVGRGMF